MDRFDFSHADIKSITKKLAGIAVRTPLLSYGGPGTREIRLKAENLQPTGSFKIRGSTAAISTLEKADLQNGIYTASAGNFGQGVAQAARKAGVKARIYVPETAARVKIAALKSLGAEVIIISQSDWWTIMVEKHAAGEEGVFLHPCADPAVVLGNATIGVEIVEDWPEVETILVPFGGGGLSLGIAIGAKSLKPDVRVIACESEAATPLRAAFEADGPVDVPFDKSTFITGIGSFSVLPEMWPHLKKWIDGVSVVSIDNVVHAVQNLASVNHIVAEGAGAVPLAVALSTSKDYGKTAAIVSGGNIDMSAFNQILATAAP